VGTKRDGADRLGGRADHLRQGGDPKHHPFASDRGTVRPAVVLVGEIVYAFLRLRPLRLLHDFPTHLDKAVGVVLLRDEVSGSSPIVGFFVLICR
jgi:hypothetical protein